jgi:hypothetical protein
MRLYISSALHFSDYSFLVHHPIHRDDRYLLAFMQWPLTSQLHCIFLNYVYLNFLHKSYDENH